MSKAAAVRYQAASKSAKVVILDELCALTSWHRDHARKALREGLRPRPKVEKRAPREPTYGEDVMAPLRKVWALMDAPACKRMAPFLPEIVDSPERAGELDLTPAVRARLCGMSAATIDRRLAPGRARLMIRGPARRAQGLAVALPRQRNVARKSQPSGVVVHQM